MHGTGESGSKSVRPAKAQEAGSPAVSLSIQGALSGAGRSGPACRRRCAAKLGSPGRRSRLLDLRRQPAARRRRGRAAARTARSTSSAACRWANCWPRLPAWKLDRRANRRSPASWSAKFSNRLQFLVDVGLEYLTLGRPAPTLSGGEAQRIRLASQVGSGLCGVLYVLDEPTIGLHPRDNRRLLEALEKLRDLGNTLLVVEHDREVIRRRRSTARLRPGGRRRSAARSSPAARRPKLPSNKDSVTGPYLSGKKAIAVPTDRRMANRRGATAAAQRQARRSAAQTRRRRRRRQTSASRPAAAGWK